jgi:hypothetical protein
MVSGLIGKIGGFIGRVIKKVREHGAPILGAISKIGKVYGKLPLPGAGIANMIGGLAGRGATVLNGVNTALAPPQ